MEVNQNPLTIDAVAQELLRYVSPSMKDLLVFRQVCRLWRELATPISVELPLIAFKAEGAEENAEDEVSGCVNCNAELSLLPKSVDYLESAVEQKIIFSGFHFNAISLDHPIVQKFLEKFGQSVRKLHLNKIKRDFYPKEPPLHRCPEKGEVNPATFRKLLLSCPELEELVLGCVDPQDGNDGFLLPDDNFETKIKKMAWVEIIEREGENDEFRPQEKFISDLLKVCPSLERFQNVEDEDGRFTRALSQSPHLASLKELTISQDDKFQTLIQDESDVKLQLTRLKFSELWIPEEEDAFCRFLDTQKSSLETLIVDNWRVDFNYGDDGVPLPPPQIQFPDVMEKLEVLKIGDIVFSYNEEDELQSYLSDFLQLFFESLDFRRQFLVLKTLILEGDAERYDLTGLFAPDREPQMVLEGLELPRGIGHQDLSNASHLFPNVKHLALRDVEGDQVNMLWRLWPLLESLFLELRNVNIDTALPGLMSQEIPVVQSLIENGEEINIPAEDEFERPSIVNFQNLKELRILGEKHKRVHNLPRASLSDVSIHYSLCKLPKLEFLGANPHTFTEAGINHLCNVRGLKWNKDSTEWPLQCQKDLGVEYKQRPTYNEDFADY